LKPSIPESVFASCAVLLGNATAKSPPTSESRNSPIARKKMIRAMSTTNVATSPKPNKAATSATIRNVIAQPNMMSGNNVSGSSVPD
jgi:hypothetical protein